MYNRNNLPMGEFIRALTSPRPVAPSMGFRGMDFREAFLNNTLPVEISVKDNEINYAFEIPGVKPEDFDIEIENRNLIIKVEKRNDNVDEDNHYTEHSYGMYQRIIRLPKEVDTNNFKANYKDGVLNLYAPLLDSKENSIKVEVESDHSHEDNAKTTDENVVSHEDKVEKDNFNGSFENTVEDNSNSSESSFKFENLASTMDKDDKEENIYKPLDTDNS